MRIALGLIHEGQMDWCTLEKFQNLAAEITRTFHHRSSRFWKSDDDADKLRADILKAALLEKFVQTGVNLCDYRRK